MTQAAPTLSEGTVLHYVHTEPDTSSDELNVGEVIFDLTSHASAISDEIEDEIEIEIELDPKGEGNVADDPTPQVFLLA